MTVPGRMDGPAGSTTADGVASAAHPAGPGEVRLLRVGPGADLAPDSAFAVALVTLWHRAETDGRPDDPAGPTRAEVAAAVAPVVDAVRTGRALGCALSRGRALIGVGVVSLGRNRSAHTATVTALVVDSAEWRHGLGTRLLDALTGYAADAGVDRITVTVPDAAGLPAFFERAGYRVWGRRPDWERPVPGAPRDELVLGTVLEEAR